MIIGQVTNDSNGIKDITNAVYIAVQSLPGTKFYLNNNKDNVITIGQTGIYELDLRESQNSSLKITNLSWASDNSPAFFIIDYIQEEGQTNG